MVRSRRELATFSMLSGAPAVEVQEEPVPSKVYLFDQLPLHHTERVDYRPIVDGKTVDGCKFSVHESALSPNQEPHPPITTRAKRCF